MEVTDELRDLYISYRKIFDDCFKEKKLTTKYIRFFFYLTVCLGVTPLSHTSEDGKNLLELKKKVWSFIYFICSVIMSCSYWEIKCYSSNFQLFWSCYSYILQLCLKISWDKNLTNTVCLFSVTFISWKSGEKNYNKIHLARLWKCC